MVGHVAPEAAKGGPIAAIREGDEITVDVDGRRLDVALSDEEIAERVADYEPPEPPYTRGVMAKYAATVSSASEGAVTGYDAPASTAARLSAARLEESRAAVEAHRPLELGTCPVRSKISSREWRMQAVVAERGPDGTMLVVAAPDDQRRDLDLGQPVEDVVADRAPANASAKPGAPQRPGRTAPRAAPAAALRVAEDAAEGELARLRPHEQRAARTGERRGPRPPASAQRLGRRALRLRRW